MQHKKKNHMKKYRVKINNGKKHKDGAKTVVDTKEKNRSRYLPALTKL